MRYFKIYNKGCTKTRPLQELTKDQYLADIADYCLDKISFMVEDEAFDAVFSDLFNKAELFANCETGLGCGDFYLYSAGDDKTVLDFNRKKGGLRVDWINSLGNYVSCPICGHLHDDGAFILTETGHSYFICFDCDEKYPGKAAREILEKMEKEADNE